MRPFRFGFQSISSDAVEVTRSAKAAEAADFDIFQVADHVGDHVSPLVALAAAAAVTSSIRLGTLVLNNDLRHPVILAQEIVTLDHVSNGRVELGLGAGHSFTEYAAMGEAFDPPAVRKARLREAVEILRPLLQGAEVSFEGAHYALAGARIIRPAQPRVPLLVGVNGRRALEHAARSADIVAPTMLGRTLEDGQHHEVRWEAERLDATMALIQRAAGHRWPHLEVHALVQAIVATEDKAGVVGTLGDRLHLERDDVVATPFLCVGSVEDMARHLLECRERWGISYFTVRDIDTFRPVMELVRQLDGGRRADS